MNHFEAHLWVSSRVASSKVLRMAIRDEYFFFPDKKAKLRMYVRNFRRFLFDMSPDTPAFKVLVVIGDFEFDLE